jgi:hypothetical protein
MAAISRLWWSKATMEDNRNGENSVRSTIKILTSDRVSWTWLRDQRVIPKFNDEHPTEPGFFLDRYTPNHIQRCYWEIETEWTPIKAGKIDPDPAARPVDITFSTSLVEQPVNWDAKRKPICTTAGEMITGVMEQIPLVDYSLVKNYAKDPAFIQTHLGAVNEDAVKLRGIVWEPKTLLFAAVSAGSYVTENRYTSSEFRLTLVGDYRGWTQEVWNRGTLRLEKQTRTKWEVKGDKLVPKKLDVWVQVPIMSGSPAKAITEPVAIDKYGQEIVDHLKPDEEKPLDPSKLIVLKFDVQRAKKFGGILPLA